jgi:hypothetical protein
MWRGLGEHLLDRGQAVSGIVEQASCSSHCRNSAPCGLYDVLKQRIHSVSPAPLKMLQT